MNFNSLPLLLRNFEREGHPLHLNVCVGANLGMLASQNKNMRREERILNAARIYNKFNAWRLCNGNPARALKLLLGAAKKIRGSVDAAR